MSASIRRPLLASLAALCAWGPLAGIAEEPPLAAGTAATAPTTSSAILQGVVMAQRKVTTVSGRFIQRSGRSDEAEDLYQVYEARFALRSPDAYNLVYTKPGNEDYRLRLCSDGSRRWQIEQIASDIPPDVLVSPVPAAGAAGGGGGVADAGDIVRRITGFFRFEDVSLLKDFSVSAAPREGGFRLTMSPIDPGLAEQVKGIVVDLDQSYSTVAIVFDDPQGNRVVVRVAEAVYNQTIPPETFTHAGP